MKWVQSPRRVPGCCQADDEVVPDLRPGRRVLRRRVAVGGVAHGDQGEDRGEHAERRRGQERRRPAGAVQQGHERDDAEDLTALAHESGDLGEHRHLPRREPGVDETQHADEGHRVAGTDEHPREDRRGERVRERERDLTDRHERRAADDHRPRTDPVHHRPDGHLHPGVHEQLDDGERAEQPGGDVEAGRGVEARDAQRRALQHRDDVRADRDAPDEPRPRRSPLHEEPVSRTPTHDPHRVRGDVTGPVVASGGR